MLWHVRRFRAPTWSRVYSSFCDVPISGPGYDGWVWLDGTREATRRALDAARARNLESLGPLGEHALLPLLAATIAGARVRVLDFGGGMGIGYATMRACLDPRRIIDYVVVETGPVGREGQMLFGPNDHVSFVASLPEDPGPIDIVYSRSALQYVEDHETALRRLLQYRARYVLLVLLTAGDIPTYASAQLNLPGSVLAHWFLDIRDVIGIAREEGYSLLMRAPSDKLLDGMSVPSKYRLSRGQNLLLARTADAATPA